MKQDRPNTQVVLIDMQYFDSINAFECWYGDNISYQEMEQRSYIELKDIIFSRINRDVKFRKYGRIGQILTLKVDMLKWEIDKFVQMLKADDIKLTHHWIISNITIIKDNNFDSIRPVDEKFKEQNEDEIDDEYDLEAEE